MNAALLAWWLASGAPAAADQWGPVDKTESYSANRKHLLRIAPHWAWPLKPGHCKAELFSLDGPQRKRIWSRHLINNHAPVRVYVADSGQYVVTMDEWHRVGQLPVVIYGPRGELVLAHSIETLGLSDDLLHIKQTVSSFWWNENSIVFFGPEEKRLFIRLHWGKMLMLDLSDGELMDTPWYDIHRGWAIPESEWKQLQAFGRRRTAERALELLRSSEAKERETGAIAVGQLGLREASSRLRSLFDDNAAYTVWSAGRGARTVYYVRRAAKTALEAMGEPADVVVEHSDPVKKKRRTRGARTRR